DKKKVQHVSSIRHNEWVTTDDDISRSTAADATAITSVGETIGNAAVQNSFGFPADLFSTPPPTINPYAALPQHIVSEITAGLSAPPPVSFQVPPPSVIVGNIPPNHGTAGFVSQGIFPNGTSMAVPTEVAKPVTIFPTKIAVDYERDIIPRSPTPPPTPPRRPNPRLRPGAMGKFMYLIMIS
ncbi:unnamed protein product, partial [Strongylus vulgaris]